MSRKVSTQITTLTTEHGVEGKKKKVRQGIGMSTYKLKLGNKCS